MDKPEFVKDEHLKFLDLLRESGTTNMFGAAPYLKQAFPNLSKQKARDIVLYWIKTFKERQNENS